VWSREAAASEWVRAEADLAREQKKLIQTSIDGQPPPMPFNQIQFAGIADWRGEDDHPGWRKVKTSPPPAAPAGASAAPATDRVRTAAVVGAIVALLLLLGGGWLWWRGEAPADQAAGDRATAVADGAQAPVPAAAPRPASALFTEAAVIDDPDGFTNVRAGPSASFPVVARVNRGEVFTTYPQTGDWWQVRTADSRVGYMARSRIRVVQPSAEAMPVAAGDVAAAAPAVEEAAAPAPIPAVAPAAAHAPRQVFPDSSRRRLRPAELAGLSPSQLRLARNEIFARHGRPFRDAALRRHFEQYPWYRPRPGAVRLSPVEQANVDLLAATERK
jgi:hypothetical protein